MRKSQKIFHMNKKVFTENEYLKKNNIKSKDLLVEINDSQEISSLNESIHYNNRNTSF